MHVYTAGQWVLLFFFYCFLGWVWESCYVSVCRRQWVNRGFLHGPLLPIYGSGAIIILFVTLPAENNLFLVWLLGMIAATALEYVTGDVMERLFKVRYWDYSKKRFNLNGHICLTSSIAWGFFSILLVRFIHPPIGRLLTRVPAFLVDPAALALTAAFTGDVVRSVQAALDLREILTRLTEENEDLRRLAKRVEVVSAFAEDDLRRFREKTEVEKLLFQERLEADRRQRQEAQARRKLRRREALEDRGQAESFAEHRPGSGDLPDPAGERAFRRGSGTPAGGDRRDPGKAPGSGGRHPDPDRADVPAGSADPAGQPLRPQFRPAGRGPGIPAEAGEFPGGRNEIRRRKAASFGTPLFIHGKVRLPCRAGGSAARRQSRGSGRLSVFRSSAVSSPHRAAALAFPQYPVRTT